MQKLILLSVIIASIVVPVRAASMRNPREGLKRTLTLVAIFNAIYLFLLMYVAGRV